MQTDGLLDLFQRLHTIRVLMPTDVAGFLVRPVFRLEVWLQCLERSREYLVVVDVLPD